MNSKRLAEIKRFIDSVNNSNFVIMASPGTVENKVWEVLTELYEDAESQENRAYDNRWID